MARDGLVLRDFLSQALERLDNQTGTGRSTPAVTPIPNLAARQAERSSLFNFTRGDLAGNRKRSRAQASKKRKTWVHDFICLSSCTANTVPTPQERAHLISAGKYYFVYMYLRGCTCNRGFIPVLE